MLRKIHQCSFCDAGNAELNRELTDRRPGGAQAASDGVAMHGNCLLDATLHGLQMSVLSKNAQSLSAAMSALVLRMAEAPIDGLMLDEVRLLCAFKNLAFAFTVLYVFTWSVPAMKPSCKFPSTVLVDIDHEGALFCTTCAVVCCFVQLQHVHAGCAGEKEAD